VPSEEGVTFERRLEPGSTGIDEARLLGASFTAAPAFFCRENMACHLAPL